MPCFSYVNLPFATKNWCLSRDHFKLLLVFPENEIFELVLIRRSINRCLFDGGSISICARSGPCALTKGGLQAWQTLPWDQPAQHLHLVLQLHEIPGVVQHPVGLLNLLLQWHLAADAIQCLLFGVPVATYESLKLYLGDWRPKCDGFREFRLRQTWPSKK